MSQVVQGTFAKAENTQTLEAFWGHYVREHSQPITRHLHVAGLFVAAAAMLAAWQLGWLWLAVVAPALVFGCAWIGHFCFEKNIPASFTNPWWSIASYFRMLGLIFTGRMEQEVARHCTPRQ